MRNLPPLPSLRAFEATARLGSVKRAADELAVTTSAISHQIAHLEGHLSTALFHRRNKRLIATDAGLNYLQHVQAALDRLADATWDVTEHGAVEQLSVAVPPSFLALWLLPLLDEFRVANPGLNLRFRQRLTLDDDIDQVDCGIEYRLTPPVAGRSEKLCDDEAFPLASPALIDAAGLRAPEDLRGQTLIGTDLRLVSWRTVLSGYDWVAECPSLTVPYSYHAFIAAQMGQGVALGNRWNARHPMAQGWLVQPFVLPGGKQPELPKYYFTALESKWMLPKVQFFWAWVRRRIEETARPAAAPPSG